MCLKKKTLRENAQIHVFECFHVLNQNCVGKHGKILAFIVQEKYEKKSTIDLFKTTFQRHSPKETGQKTAGMTVTTLCTALRGEPDRCGVGAF